MSSPISRTESPSLDEHAKRKRDEIDALEKQASQDLSADAGTKGETDLEETVPPKKMQVQHSHHRYKPEESPVSRAEVKQIQRNLKTMPLEDKNNADTASNQSKDMDDVESDPGNAEDQIQDTESTPASDLGDREITSADTTVHSTKETASDNGSEAAQSTLDSPSTSPSVSSTKLGTGFSNTSSVSPFANVKPGESVFGSLSSTLKGFGATSTASPFASVENKNVFGDKSSSLSSGFGNTSSVSPFASTASSTNTFGGDSSKSVFGQSSSTSASGFGANAGSTNESTAGSVFGARSIVGSVAGASPSRPTTSAFSATVPTSLSSGGSFSTFGAKNSFAKEASFTSGSFIGLEGKQDKADFGSLLSQDTGDQEGDVEQQDGDEGGFGTGVFTSADQIDVQTGEEDEISIYQTKGKLYADTDKTHAWKERGKGTFKVNVDQHDTKLARLVMRADGVLRLILNVAIFPDMNVVVTGDKYVRFIGIEEGKPISFLLKVKDATVANEVVEGIKRATERQARKSYAVTLKD
ncbi:hypothetical protein EDD11_004693 [Mortierella claussenii]|nr:hypothetical protein EDD11_004693 [Mortierella claussenii]